jgi:CheY-like chemotaxis protein
MSASRCCGPANAVERLQATAFVGTDDASVAPSFRLFRASVSVDDLRATVARYLGEERTNRSFEGFAKSRGGALEGRSEADIHLLRYAEHLLASVIGAASSRLRCRCCCAAATSRRATRCASSTTPRPAIQYSRELLQHALDHARQGITVLDQRPSPARLEPRLHRPLRAAAGVRAHRRRPRRDRPPQRRARLLRPRRGRGGGAAQRIHSFVHDSEPQRVRLQPTGRVIEVRTNKLPGGGFVTTYTDATETVAAEEARKRANELLEQRVRERTEELTAAQRGADACQGRGRRGQHLEDPLPRGGKPRHPAAAERARGSTPPRSSSATATPAIPGLPRTSTPRSTRSRRSSRAARPVAPRHRRHEAAWTSFRIDEMFRQLQLEFDPIAGERRLAITFVPTALTVRSDRRLLRRLLQNLISNAIKYTPSGRVLVGARRRGDRVSLQVWDTGLGIPASKQKLVFHEFQRLDQGAKVARGLGLGLSIVERVARVLDHPIALSSEPGRGSVFRVEVPIAAAQPRASSRSGSRAARRRRFAGLTVLAIDNEPSILEACGRFSPGGAARSSPAASLDAAREAMARRLPEVIVADYHLDEGNGLQVVAALRRAYAAEIPAVLVTADRSPAVREAAAAATVHVLNKPLKPAALRALLAQWRATRVAAE